jgi:hypothetical protein
MGRRSYPTNSLESLVRLHFGLSQVELGRYLGISGRQVGNLEVGTRESTSAVNKRLFVLADLLPAPEGRGPEPPSFKVPELPPAPAATLLATLPDFGVVAPGPLRKRQLKTLSQSNLLRWALYKAGQAAARQSRRQWALAVLQAGFATLDLPPAERARVDRWLPLLADEINANAPDDTTAATQALRVVRLLALEAEAVALGQLLGPAAVVPRGNYGVASG